MNDESKQTLPLPSFCTLNSAVFSFHTRFRSWSHSEKFRINFVTILWIRACSEQELAPVVNTNVLTIDILTSRFIPKTFLSQFFFFEREGSVFIAHQN